MELINYSKLNVHKKTGQVSFTIPSEIVHALNLQKIKNTKVFVDFWREREEDQEIKVIVIQPLIEDDK
jgi:hypothetical protein